MMPYVISLSAGERQLEIYCILRLAVPITENDYAAMRLAQLADWLGRFVSINWALSEGVARA